ncbi:hypothetical protein VNI00_018493 [Paramarasmius palmivorus]|uniref:Uncharacterized protein n=1 Tax=Paramarasmius palmivorus TaxID=297713 RepID=A0AAW0AX20_9AGAR
MLPLVDYSSESESETRPNIADDPNSIPPRIKRPTSHNGNAGTCVGSVDNSSGNVENVNLGKCVKSTGGKAGQKRKSAIVMLGFKLKGDAEMRPPQEFRKHRSRFRRIPQDPDAAKDTDSDEIEIVEVETPKEKKAKRRKTDPSSSNDSNLPSSSSSSRYTRNSLSLPATPLPKHGDSSASPFGLAGEAELEKAMYCIPEGDDVSVLV